tara:strand:+ start:770 stop:1129 length:360 start_codon:yes stop_codon:yes gene_type:complete
MRRSTGKSEHGNAVALFADHFKRLLNRWNMDTFEFGALVLAAFLLLCPLFRLGAWLAEQRAAAQRQVACAEDVDAECADADADAEDDADVEDDGDADDHEEEARTSGALKGARIKRDRV